MDHYCEAFYCEPGCCWRMVYNSDGSGRPTLCSEPVEWRARFRDRRGKWHVVDSCAGHVQGEQLVDVKRQQVLSENGLSSPRDQTRAEGDDGIPI